MNPVERSCLLIADISGYTSYLAGVELDHAQDILADLVGTVVTTMQPTFRRWRPDKPPEACRYDQLETSVPFELARIFGDG